jgi:hypothetical protein
MQAREQDLTQVVDAILRYLDSHPDAADTVEGITKWWLPAAWCVDIRTAQSALARLEKQGLVHRRIHADQHVLYSR